MIPAERHSGRRSPSWQPFTIWLPLATPAWPDSSPPTVTTDQACIARSPPPIFPIHVPGVAGRPATQGPAPTRLLSSGNSSGSCYVRSLSRSPSLKRADVQRTISSIFWKSLSSKKKKSSTWRRPGRQDLTHVSEVLHGGNLNDIRGFGFVWSNRVLDIFLHSPQYWVITAS